MKVTLNWLRQFVDSNWPPEEPSERRTMPGVKRAPDFRVPVRYS
ncbi:MAG: hypothetical protein AAB676_21160 [Verrucomicrobiota bacterium]